MAGDGLIEDRFFITSIRFKNGYLEFKEFGNRLILVGIGKMYGIQQKAGKGDSSFCLFTKAGVQLKAFARKIMKQKELSPVVPDFLS